MPLALAIPLRPFDHVRPTSVVPRAARALTVAAGGASRLARVVARAALVAGASAAVTGAPLPAQGADSSRRSDDAVATRDRRGGMPADTGAYASRAIADLVTRAAARNALPTGLDAYSADVESEITLIIRRADGTEVVGGIEQVASRLRWTRTGVYEQRIVGHRVQQLGANISMLTLFDRGWLQPVLYGNRLRIVDGPPETGEGAGVPATRRDSASPTARRRARRAPRDTVQAIHPLADDREPWYRYTGGDTVVVIRDRDRRITVQRVHVAPRDDASERAVLFEGDLDLDAERGVLVRMRGRFVRIGPPRRTGGLLSRAIVRTVTAAGFVDYENGERDAQWWLPVTQRLELQAAAPLFGDGRAVFRVVSRVDELRVNDTTLEARDIARADSLRRLAAVRGTGRRLRFAPTDSLAAFAAWQREPGALSLGLHADDFDDVGPDVWRTVGPPRFDWGVPFVTDAFRFNRVEGLFTGFGARWALRDAAPGVTVRATAGWAWQEQAARGRLELERRRDDPAGTTTWTLRTGRQLDITNDFRITIDSGSSLAAVSGQDEYDYVEQTFALAERVRTAADRAWQWRADAGIVDDGALRTAYERAPIGGLAFRPNRRVDPGTYARASATWLWRPDGAAEFLRSGNSARVRIEAATGGLEYARLEGRIATRRLRGPLTLVARADAGVIVSAAPPTQQLFELGRTQGLPAYDYKAFAGTQAVNLRSLVLYEGPWWRAPIRVRGLVLPAFAPGASVGFYAGATGAPTPAGRDAVARLGSVLEGDLAPRPVSVTSDGLRTSVSAGLRFFSGIVFVGGARSLERDQPWRWLITVGQQL